MLFLVAFIILSLLSLLSLFKVIEKLHFLNVIGTFMFSYITIAITGIVINLNLELTKSAPGGLVFWTQKIPEIFLKPVIIVWLLVLLLSDYKLVLKIAIITLFISSLVSIEVLFQQLGYLKFVKWNMFYSYLRYTLVVALTVIFSWFLGRKIMERGKL